MEKGKAIRILRREVINVPARNGRTLYSFSMGAHRRVVKKPRPVSLKRGQD